MKNQNKKDFFSQIERVAADNRRVWKSVLLAVVLFIWEAAILFFYVEGILHLVFFILLHCAAIGAAAFFTYLSNKNRDDLRFPLLLLLSIFAAGPFGLGGYLILCLLFPLFRSFSIPFIKWFQDLFPEVPSIYENVFERIRSGWDDYSKVAEVIPFKDIFTYGTLYQKQSVLDAVIKDYTPSYAPVLKMALDDSRNVIRIQAAAIVAKINADFEEKLQNLIKKSSPENPVTYLDLAHHFDAHAFTGILDSIREKENQENALHYYREYLKIDPDNKGAWFSVGRLLFRLGSFREAVEWFDSYKKKFHELEGNARAWYLESLYMLGRYSELAEAAQSAMKETPEFVLPESVKETVKVWSQQEAG